jgi:hypothetical protein
MKIERRKWQIAGCLWLTVPLTASASVSVGMRLDMDPSRWSYPDPFQMSFANSPKRIFDQHCATTRHTHVDQ